MFKHFTQDNGLLSNKVSAIYQDKQGYMWIGGFNGLQRYDGYRFTNFYSELHNEKALHTNVISNIFEDSKGRLWIGTDKDGIYLLNRNDNTFYSYNSNAVSEKNKAIFVRTICEDANKNIWFSTNNGFYELNNTTNLFENKSKSLGFDSLDYASTISSDEKGNLWFCGIKTFKYFDVKTNIVFDKNNNPGKLKIFDIAQSPARIDFGRNNTLWFATPNNVLYKFTSDKNQIEKYEYKDILQQLGVSNIPQYNFDYFVTVSSSKNNVIIGFAELGIAIYDDTKKGFNFIASNKDNYFGLHNFAVGTDGVNILTDKDGVLWICGSEGVEYFNPDKQNFIAITKGSDINAKQSLPSLEVSGILQSKHAKDIFISYYSYKTTSGIYRVDSNFNVKQHYIVNPNKEGGINQIWGLFEDEEGIIWAPTQDKIILQLNPKTNELKSNVDSSLKGYINYITKDKNGDLWIGYWSKGLKIFNARTKQVTSLSNDKKYFAAPIKSVYQVYFDGDSLAWISTHDNGLVCYDKRSNEFVKSYTYNRKDIHSISSNIVSSVCAYNADTLLVATSEGLGIFSKSKQQFTTITNKQGLPSNFVVDVFIDATKNIWVCCANGICKINPKNWLVTNFSTQDGLIEKGITRGLGFLDNNEILLGNVNGLIKFNSKEISNIAKPSNVAITSFLVINQNILFDSLWQNNLPVKLNYQQNNLSIGFSSFNYSFQNKITYYYKLDGVDRDWVIATNDAMARYNNLNNGKYIFSVKALNDNGVECNNITNLTIIIESPFYKTWWFILLEIIVAGIIIWGILKWRNRNTKRIKTIEAIQQQLNRQLAETKMQALRSQMNPHFVFNSLNSINHFILSHDTDNASNYLTKFSRLIRLILDNSRSEWGFLENEIKALELYIQLEAVRFDNVFKYDIHIDEDVPVATLQIPPLIIQPYVENAIWHGLLHKQDGEAKLQINIWMENDVLNIKVTDNGVGREKAIAIKSNKTLLHKSHGMKITSERLDIANNLYKINAQVKVEDLKDAENNSIGTSVLITINPKRNESNNS